MLRRPIGYGCQWAWRGLIKLDIGMVALDLG